MNYVSLGRTGVQVSQLCLGGGHYGINADLELSRQVISHAIDSGINFIDTADIYVKGRSEQIIGQVLLDLGCRDKIVLATKFHNKMSEDVNSRGNHRRHIVEACEASLERLHTDYIDLYQVHRPQSSIPIDETLRALDDLVRAGKVLYIGSSNFAAWQLCESLWVAKELGLNRFVSEQPPYNMFERSIERELLPFCRSYGFAVLCWSPLAGGMLSGKYRRGQAPPPGSRYEDTVKEQARFTAEGFAAVEGLRTLAAELGCSMTQMALRWLIQQPGVTAPIIAPRNVEQLDDNLKTIEISLGTEDLEEIDRLCPPFKTIGKVLHEGDFGPSKYTWV